MKEMLDKILQLEEGLIQEEQIMLDVQHDFAPGIYARTLFIPAGTLLTGKIHRKELMNILVSGTLHITYGDETEVMDSPKVFNSYKGSKKAIYAETDAVLMNIHPTELDDLDEIEDEFIAPSYEALEADTKAALEMK